MNILSTQNFYESKSAVEYFQGFYKLLMNITNALVLDVGCGIGYASKILTDSENEVLSLEINDRYRILKPSYYT